MKRRVFLSGFLTASFAAFCPVLTIRAEETSESASDGWDVIVVGAGLAGLSAAVAAREAGARRVALLEKDALIGGHSIMSSGYFNAVDPKRQTPQGIDDSVELMVRQSLEVGEFQGDPELMRIMAVHSENAVNWLEKHGVRWSDNVFESLSSMQKRAHVSSPFERVTTTSWHSWKAPIISASQSCCSTTSNDFFSKTDASAALRVFGRSGTGNKTSHCAATPQSSPRAGSAPT